jgi:hypothetical protein
LQQSAAVQRHAVPVGGNIKHSRRLHGLAGMPAAPIPCGGCRNSAWCMPGAHPLCREPVPRPPYRRLPAMLNTTCSSSLECRVGRCGGQEDGFTCRLCRVCPIDAYHTGGCSGSYDTTCKSLRPLSSPCALGSECSSDGCQGGLLLQTRRRVQCVRRYGEVHHMLGRHIHLAERRYMQQGARQWKDVPA